MASGKSKPQVSSNPRLKPGNYEIEVYHLSSDNNQLGCRILRLSGLENRTKKFVVALEGFENPEHLIQVLASRSLRPLGFSTPLDYPYRLDVEELAEVIAASHRLYPRYVHA